MKEMHRVPLVGAYFHPPAAAIIRRLPAEAPLRIVPEPDNPHDANALAVHLVTGDYPKWFEFGAQDAEFENELAGFGLSIEAVLSAESFHLGYIARADAARLAGTISLVINDDHTTHCPAKLSFDPAGKPQVVLEL